MSIFHVQQSCLGALCAAALFFLAAPAQALDLLESYQAALSEDADYQAARAAANAGREALPLARSQLLPNLSANAARTRNDLETETSNLAGQTNTLNSKYPSTNYSLTLRQALYRPAQYAGYLQAFAQVAGSEASFDKAGQDLAVRVAGAYFNVLLAEETLRQVESQQVAIVGQLAAAKRALEAGQGTRTDIDDAQAKLDLNRAKLLSARQQIDQTRHELQILVNRPVDNLRPLDKQRLELHSLHPIALTDWIERAALASPELREMKARVEVARHETARAWAGHKPTLDLIVQRSISENDNVTNPNSRFDNSQIGVQLAVPLFAGGYVSAQLRQAQAVLVEAEQRHESVRRKLATQVRKEYQGVQEGILKVQALTLAEYSTDQSVISNEKGFRAGIRSRIDILNAGETRGSVRLELARERVLYAMSRVRLLALSGELNEAAIAGMNRWLAE